MIILKKTKYPKVKCGRCGSCCRIPLVPVTHRDVARLVKRTGFPAGKIVRFCHISEMDYDEESGLWILFRSGKRAMVLRRRSGRCIFQTPARACAFYAARPQTCRTFPYSVDFADVKNSVVDEIRLNGALKCNALKCKEIDVDFLIDNVRKENRDDRAYHKLVKRWNDQNKKGGALDFLRFIGF